MIKKKRDLLGSKALVFAGGFVDFAHGVEHQIGRGAQNGAMSRSLALDKFVNARIILEAVLENVDDRFIPEERAALGVGDVAGIEKKQSVGIAGVDVQSASLVRVAKHLHDAGKIVVGEAAAEAGVGLR